MAHNAKNTVRLGLFVTLGILLFTLAVYFIGARQNVFGNNYRVSTFFNNVGGLRIGNNVRYAGINVGSVEDIVFENDSTLRVDMRLDEKVKDFIKRDATASIGSDGLVGNMLVNISPGKGSGPPVGDGEMIASFSRIETDDILKTLGNTNDNIAILALNLLEITEKLNEGDGTLPRLIRDSMMAVNVTLALENLRRTTEVTLLMSKQIQQSVDHITRGNGLLGQLIYDTTMIGRFESTAMRIDTLLTRKTEPIIADLRQSGEDIAAASAALRMAATSIYEGEGLAATLLTDTAAARDVQEILQNLNEGTVRFNENMEALKHNFLFRKYFKKQEKKKLQAQESAQK